jgi:hypothetical protein
MNGSKSATVLSEMLKDKMLGEIPFYILTAYEDDSTKNRLKKDCILDIFTKPLNRNNVELLISNIR